jgi:hypothetical protein
MRAISLPELICGCSAFSDVEQRVLTGLIYLMDWESWSGTASIRQMAFKSGKSIATVKKVRRSLQDKGVITIERSSNRFGEESARIWINVEKINDLAVATLEPTLAPSEPTLAPSEPTLAPNDTSEYLSEPTLAPNDTSMAPIDTSRYLSEPPLSVSSVLPVSIPAPSVVQSVDSSVNGSVDDAAREPDAAPTPAWRTLPERSNGWLFSRAYFNIVKNDLGHDHNGITTITNAIAAAKVYPDRVDIQAFLAQHPHLTH